jgi:hypothetical protein
MYQTVLSIDIVKYDYPYDCPEASVCPPYFYKSVLNTMSCNITGLYDQLDPTETYSLTSLMYPVGSSLRLSISGDQCTILPTPPHLTKSVSLYLALTFILIILITLILLFLRETRQEDEYESV